jgi:hypothetical protein
VSEPIRIDTNGGTTFVIAGETVEITRSDQPLCRVPLADLREFSASDKAVFDQARRFERLTNVWMTVGKVRAMIQLGRIHAAQVQEFPVHDIAYVRDVPASWGVSTNEED